VSAVATASAGEGARPTATLEASVASVASGETACEGDERQRGHRRGPAERHELPRVRGERLGEAHEARRVGVWLRRERVGARAERPAQVPERPPQARQVREVRGRREHLCAREVGERARLGVAEHDQRAEPLRGDRARQKVRAVLRGGGHHRSRHGDVQPLLIELEDHGVGADALDDLAHLLRGGAPGRVHGADDVELVATAARVHARDCPDAPR
jgi:hypothetical protein